MNPKRVTYKNWAGISIVGTQVWNLDPTTTSHLTRAAWLTAFVETGAKFGTVQSYDGAGISAGIEHKIAVLPKTLDQGSLWKLLDRLPDSPAVLRLVAALQARGWYIDPRGQLRASTNGRLVSGTDIRSEFAPPSGTVPSSGPHFDKAVEWARLWSEAFSDPATFRAQIEEAKKSLLAGHKDVESEVYSRYASLEDASAATTQNISPELDLAMCIYHSFSVNAPTRARTVLREVLALGLSERVFSKTLVTKLGTNTFANWKQRYERTSAKVISSKLWTQITLDNVLI